MNGLELVGILEELKIHPDLDRSVFIGYGVAETLFGIEEEPTTIYVRANPTYIEDVVEVLAPSMNPENPDQVEVTRAIRCTRSTTSSRRGFYQPITRFGISCLTCWRSCNSKCYGHVCS